MELPLTSSNPNESNYNTGNEDDSSTFVLDNQFQDQVQNQPNQLNILPPNINPTPQQQINSPQNLSSPSVQIYNKQQNLNSNPVEQFYPPQNDQNQGAS